MVHAIGRFHLCLILDPCSRKIVGWEVHGTDDDLRAARSWAAEFVRWYKDEGRHGGMRYVTPAQRHDGEDHAIFTARHALSHQPRGRNPARWSGTTRDRTPTGPVTLKPERDSIVVAHSISQAKDGQPLAAWMRRQQC
jgi:putative transposase